MTGKEPTTRAARVRLGFANHRSGPPPSRERFEYPVEQQREGGTIVGDAQLQHVPGSAVPTAHFERRRHACIRLVNGLRLTR